ncbi:SprT family protein [Alkalihalobacillus trypoxylicola]|uniref:Protein SprT-like n=1 Tax=Alkalihalobacillus trypoxylicola TaxID=519424 RepID=A0A162F3G3_9BACI|nr:SprT family protein [Alkalihalobacillus trypoxylicola]KYG34408.1 SprT family protein [Alkalihalobacillus trypoxylicola]
MEQKELQKLVEDLSIQFFKRPFIHEARFNHRLRTTGGRYLLRSHDIEINPKQWSHFGEEALIGIIKHELCHYHLHILKKGYKHSDRDFQELLQQVDGSRYCEHIPGTGNRSNAFILYQCQSCELIYKRKRQINTSKYVCGKCSGKLKKLLKNS